MIQPDEFDAFYKDARARLLLQTYALTGDLPAARSAVRDSFIVTWHHWRKVSRMPDPEAWVRPHAWAQAQRRHTARLWHRDKSLEPHEKATFDALGKLSLTQRKTLLLHHLTLLPVTEAARELGMPVGEAERQLAVATERFAGARNVAPEEVPALFEPMRARVEGSPWPRSTILRRAGAARRRTHTLVGALVAVAAVFATGTMVSGSTLEGQREELGADPDPVETGSTSPQAAFTDDRLLTGEELELLVDGRAWRDGRTGDNRRGSGRVTPCQQQRYADPDGVATMVRTFTTSPRRDEADVSAVQYAELSRTTRASKRAWRTALQWYGGCATPRMQLIGTYAVSGIGDGAHLFHLRSWKDPATTYVVGVAHTGQILTVTSTGTAGAADPELSDAAGFLAGSINGLCTATPGARCAGNPEVSAIRPVRVGTAPGLVIEADLPRVSEVDRPWVGTPPLQARTNPAATGCDRADFTQESVSHAMTRTFVIPRAGLPEAFGLTETVGSLSRPRAETFVQTVRDRMASCEERDLGTEVDQLETIRKGDTELAVWRVTSELTDEQTVTYLMGIAREGTAVAQVGFVPAPGVFIEQADFTELVRRAGDRLEYLPGPGPR
jgi:DNA-directed RNA polymerase specialized sigma24 family protein